MRLIDSGDILHRAAGHMFGDFTRGRLCESLADIGHFLMLVEIERLAEERFLIAEGGIETRPRDPHRFGEIGQRRAFITLAPEDVQRLR